MGIIITNITITDTWTDEQILNDLQKHIPNYGHIKGNVQKAKITIIIERESGNVDASQNTLPMHGVSFAKRKVCRCYEAPPKKHADKCDTCGRDYI